MENVKNLVQHDGGKTFKTILTTLEGLGYKTHFKVLNSGHFGIPQHRERIYIVAFRNDIANKDTFRFPSMELTSSLNDILEDNPDDAKIIERNDIHIYKSTALWRKDITQQTFTDRYSKQRRTRRTHIRPYRTLHNTECQRRRCRCQNRTILYRQQSKEIKHSRMCKITRISRKFSVSDR